MTDLPNILFWMLNNFVSLTLDIPGNGCSTHIPTAQCGTMLFLAQP
jgi:hypothetical protein